MSILGKDGAAPSDNWDTLRLKLAKRRNCVSLSHMTSQVLKGTQDTAFLSFACRLYVATHIERQKLIVIILYKNIYLEQLFVFTGRGIFGCKLKMITYRKVTFWDKIFLFNSFLS